MIYIATHKDFNEIKTSDNYRIITSNPLSGKYTVPVIDADNALKSMKHSYSEGFHLYEIWTSLQNTDFIGLNHYRRYFDIEEEENIIPIPLKINLNKQYGECHNINDLLQVEKIIDEKFPDYHLDYKNINILYPCNMFVLERGIFNKYCSFLFSVLNEFNKQNHLFTDDDVKTYVERNKQYYRNFNLEYQSRLQGFLMERLSTIFFLKTFKDKSVVHKEIKVAAKKNETLSKQTTSPNIDNIKLFGITFTWNEEKMIPYAMEYAKRLGFDKLIVYDNQSTDNTVELLKQYDFVEVRTLDTGNEKDNQEITNIKNNAWKEFKNEENSWVTITDFDEVLFYDGDFKKYLLLKTQEGCNYLNQNMFQTICEKFPDTDSLVHENCDGGVFWDSSCGCKLTLFKVDDFTDIKYVPGAHRVSVVTKPYVSLNSLNNQEVKSFHIKYIDKEYCLERKNIANKRRGKNDIKHGYGRQYAITNETFLQEWEKLYSQKISVKQYLNGTVCGNYNDRALIHVNRRISYIPSESIGSSGPSDIVTLLQTGKIRLRNITLKQEVIKSDVKPMEVKDENGNVKNVFPPHVLKKHRANKIVSAFRT